MSPIEKQLAEARIALRAVQSQRDVHGRRDEVTVERLHHRVQQLELQARGDAERARRSATETAVAKADGLEVAARFQVLAEDRRACTTPFDLNRWERMHGVEFAALNRRLAELQAGPAAPDPLAAHRASVRATHQRLQMTNPMAASAYERRHPEIHEPTEPPPAA